MITVPLDGSSDGVFLLDSNKYNVEEGQRETTIYTVTVKDPNGGVSVAVTVTFTVVGNAEFDEDTNVQCVEEGVFEIVFPTNGAGLSINDAGQLCINTTDPDYELPEGDNVTIATVVCLDANCDETEEVVIIVNGVNDPPVAQPILEEYMEQTGPHTIDVLRTVVDVDGEPIVITEIVRKEGDVGGITLNDTILNINTNFYDLLAGENETIVYDVVVNDGIIFVVSYI
jgi:hypothetical protein